MTEGEPAAAVQLDVTTHYVKKPSAGAPIGATVADPRLRALLLTFRRALLMMADAVAVYCEIGEKTVR